MQIARARYQRIRDEKLDKLGGPCEGRFREAAEILDSLVLTATFDEFLTLPAYQYID